MPELRLRTRRNRASNNRYSNAIVAEADNKLTVRTRQRRAAQRRKQKEPIVAVDEKKVHGVNNFVDNAAGLETKPPRVQEEEENNELRVLKEEVAEKMDEYDSGGRSGDKGPGAEDEGSTAPLPEKVFLFPLLPYLFGNLLVVFCLDC